MALLILMSENSFSQKNLCSNHSAEQSKSFKSLIFFIEKDSVKKNLFLQDKVSVGERIKTQQKEETTISFSKPYKINFRLYPDSEIEILKLPTEECGPQIKLIKGKIESAGNHPISEKCSFEIETEEAFIQPTGTTYLAESGALVEALAELNGEEVPSRHNLVGVGQTGTIEVGTQEKYSVEKGSIKIKLKRISKNKFKNPIKIAKLENKKIKSKKSLAKNKDKKRFLAYNEKIKLKKGSSLSVKRKKSMKKTQTAELEIIDPSGL
jgi:hypothetical protein